MEEIKIQQTVAVLVDGNNMDKSANTFGEFMMMDYDRLIPRIIGRRSLTKFFYLREGKKISKKLADRLHKNFYGIVKPCYKSADVPLTIEAVQLVDKVDTIIILSGDSDYIELVKYLSARGCRTEIAAFRFSASSALIEIADFYHEITPDDCFTVDRHHKDETSDLAAEFALEVKEPVPGVKPEKKKHTILPKDTKVTDVTNPTLTGRVVSYSNDDRAYTIMLDSGTETKWRRNNFKTEEEEANVSKD